MLSVKIPRYIDASAYPLLIALIISLLLHFALLTKLGPSSQNRGISNLPLQVRLAISAPPTPKMMEAINAESQMPKKSRQKILPPARSESATATSTNITPKTEFKSTELDTLQPFITEVPRQVEQQPEIPVPNQNSPASWAEIEFDIFSGVDRKLVSTGVQHYEADAHGRYILSFKEKIDPIKPLRTEPWYLEITGRITQHGLVPTNYHKQGVFAEHLMAFDNASGSNSATQNGRMPDGLLDRQSLLFQFMFSPPINTEGELMLTDGQKFDTYNYRVESSELIGVKAHGEIRTLHLTLLGNEYRNILEIWLAPDFRYLPVKIRQTDLNGDVSEQLATSILFK